jgi:hypothetical protein
MQEQVNEEFDAARAGYLARREAGAIRYVSHQEAERRTGASGLPVNSRPSRKIGATNFRVDL